MDAFAQRMFIDVGRRVVRPVRGGPVKVDMHGEPPNAGDEEFTSYWEERQLSSAQGSFTAPFTGKHGWYWRNKGETPVTVKLRTSGFYQDLFRPHAE